MACYLQLPLLLAVAVTGANTATTYRLGSEIKPSLSGVNVAGATFLMEQKIRGPGRVFAYSAYFRNMNKVRFQIWRPFNMSVANPKDFRLIAETKLQPSVENQREDVYIVSRLTEKCILVEEGDRLGIYLEEAPGAIAYKFMGGVALTLGYTVSNLSNPTTINETVRFDSPIFPYLFSVAAYIDTEIQSDNDTIDGDFINCPNKFIPKYEDVDVVTTTPLPPLTGKPGETGPAGPRGATGLQGPRGATGESGPEGPAGATGPQGPQGAQGINGSTGPVGPEGRPGVNGSDGSTGVMGPKGEKGDKGDKGDVGATGPRGDTGIVPTPAEVVQSDSFWADKDLIKWVSLWLLIVSVFLVLMFLCLLCLLCRRRQKQQNQPSIYSPAKMERALSASSSLKGDNPPDSPGPNSPTWIASMRADETKDYENDTITRESSAMQKDHNGTSNMHGDISSDELKNY